MDDAGFRPDLSAVDEPNDNVLRITVSDGIMVPISVEDGGLSSDNSCDMLVTAGARVNDI
jgi:hypothetical protein